MPVKGQHRYSTGECEKFAAKFLELGSAPKAAAFFGVHPYFVRDAVRRIGHSKREYAIAASAMRRAIQGDDEAKVVAQFKAGDTYVALAAKFGVTANAVRECIERNGARVRRRGPFLKATAAQKAAIFDAFRLGKTLPELSAGFELSIGTVRKALRDRGVEHIPRRAKVAKYINRLGYVELLVPEADPLYKFAKAGGYMLEHRYVVGKFMGRPLEDHESVHHINGDKADNRLTNLQLRHGKHGTGTRLVCAQCGSHNIKATAL